MIHKEVLFLRILVMHWLAKGNVIDLCILGLFKHNRAVLLISVHPRMITDIIFWSQWRLMSLWLGYVLVMYVCIRGVEWVCLDLIRWNMPMAFDVVLIFYLWLYRTLAHLGSEIFWFVQLLIIKKKPCIQGIFLSFFYCKLLVYSVICMCFMVLILNKIMYWGGFSSYPLDRTNSLGPITRPRGAWRQLF